MGKNQHAPFGCMALRNRQGQYVQSRKTIGRRAPVSLASALAAKGKCRLRQPSRGRGSIDKTAATRKRGRKWRDEMEGQWVGKNQPALKYVRIRYHEMQRRKREGVPSALRKHGDTTSGVSAIRTRLMKGRPAARHSSGTASSNAGTATAALYNALRLTGCLRMAAIVVAARMDPHTKTDR